MDRQTLTQVWDQTRQKYGVYLRLRFKFDEDLFGARDPEVNRSLPRTTEARTQ